MEKSAFDKIKESMCERIMKTKTLADLNDELNFIQEEYDLDEEDMKI